jgi:hypothetical protein
MARADNLAVYLGLAKVRIRGKLTQGGEIHKTRRKIIRQWMVLPEDKRQTAERRRTLSQAKG